MRAPGWSLSYWRDKLIFKRCKSVFALIIVISTLLPIAGRADKPSDGPPRPVSTIARLIAAQGVTGYERDVREAISEMLPASIKANSRVDETGNLILKIGAGEPVVVIAAPMDEVGYVVSRITDDGYIRLNRVGRGVPSREWDQFYEGQ